MTMDHLLNNDFSAPATQVMTIGQHLGALAYTIFLGCILLGVCFAAGAIKEKLS